MPGSPVVSVPGCSAGRQCSEYKATQTVRQVVGGIRAFSLVFVRPTLKPPSTRREQWLYVYACVHNIILDVVHLCLFINELIRCH